MKQPQPVSNQKAPSERCPVIRIADRSFIETPKTFELGHFCFILSPTVNPIKFSGDAPRPGPPTGSCTGSSTTLTVFFRSGSHQSLATMPELDACLPESITECPGPVSVLACRYRALLNTAPRSSNFLKPSLKSGANRVR